MVKNKKMSKTSIAVIVLALLLVFSLVMGMTGAWFTDKADNGAGVDLTFGTVELNVTASSFGTVTRASGTYTAGDDIMPGDTISYALTVEGASGSEDFWFAVVVNVEGAGSVTGSQASIAEGDVQSWTGTAVPCAGSLVLTGANYDNAYQGEHVTLTYVVVAVQKANVANAAAAAPLLQAAVAKTQHADGSAIA